MSSLVRIGQYQLENLQRNRVSFLYLDLQAPENRATLDVQHFLVAGSHSVSPENALKFVMDRGTALDFPIVLICENGSKSVAVAQQLEENSYINVFAIEGGWKSIDLG